MQGTSIAQFGFWEVVDPGGQGRRRFIVVDTSVTPALKVFGPDTKALAIAYARTNANVWAATHGQTAD